MEAIEAWCSMKSVRPRKEGRAVGDAPDEPGGRNAEIDFHSEKRSNATRLNRRSDALLYRKSPGTGAKLC